MKQEFTIEITDINNVVAFNNSMFKQFDNNN